MKLHFASIVAALCLALIPLSAEGGSCSKTKTTTSSCSKTKTTSSSCPNTDSTTSSCDSNNSSSSCSSDDTSDRLGLSTLMEGEAKGYSERWTCIVGSSDNAVTMIKLSAITSVSKHTYLLEGTTKILEVTIDTDGNNSIRFYCLVQGNTSQALGSISNSRQLASKYSGQSVKFPAKKYPEGTHSHNVEYQLSSPMQVNRIYESVTNAWVKNSSASLRVSG